MAAKSKLGKVFYIDLRKPHLTIVTCKSLSLRSKYGIEQWICQTVDSEKSTFED